MKQKKLYPPAKYEFVDKALYLPKIKTLAIGDLHLGHEFLLLGVKGSFPLMQMRETKKDIDEIFKKLKKEKKEVKRVIFLGDVKYFFHYQNSERNRFLEIMLLLSKYVNRKNIIIVKGNHEKIANLADKKLLDFYIEKDIAFIHGDILFNKVLGKKVKTIVMSHLHPAVILKDSQKVKQEKYKCFLTGRFKRKDFIILPSFLPNLEGTAVNMHLTNNYCIVPVKILKKFKVHAVGENKIFDFGVLGKL